MKSLSSADRAAADAAASWPSPASAVANAARAASRSPSGSAAIFARSGASFAPTISATDPRSDVSAAKRCAPS